MVCGVFDLVNGEKDVVCIIGWCAYVCDVVVVFVVGLLVSGFISVLDY